MTNHLNYRIVGKVDTDALKKAVQLANRSTMYSNAQENSAKRIFTIISAAIAIMAINKIAKKIMS